MKQALIGLMAVWVAGAGMAALAPRLRDLGVDHVLVALPTFSLDTFGAEVSALRELVYS